MHAIAPPLLSTKYIFNPPYKFLWDGSNINEGAPKNPYKMTEPSPSDANIQKGSNTYMKQVLATQY